MENLCIDFSLVVSKCSILHKCLRKLLHFYLFERKTEIDKDLVHFAKPPAAGVSIQVGGRKPSLWSGHLMPPRVCSKKWTDVSSGDRPGAQGIRSGMYTAQAVS